MTNSQSNDQNNAVKGNMVGKLTSVVVLCIVSILVLLSSSRMSHGAQSSQNGSPKLGKLVSTKRNRTTQIDPLSVSLECLTIVSMNLAGCQPSQSAPRDWNQQMSTDAARTLLLQSNPDIIALQECPGGIRWAERVFDESSHYRVMGATASHADQVILLVKNGIQAEPVPLPPGTLPSVMTELHFGANRRLLIASVHLEPFERGAKTRRAQVERLLLEASIRSKPTPLIFLGDTNMRQSEDEVMEGQLNLLDVWKLAGSDPGTKFTWDTIDHRKDGGSFNRYYGESTRQYTARYDRIYIYTANSSIAVENTPTFRLIGNQPIASNDAFLSDHFGMFSKINLKWQE